ncbi:MAG: DNA translocase FtsK 4TM domain-containing protein [Alphaproteobacteria bacterium]|nr:DNA translocase FtsK 4TM domain-containing protein [Alphaproteobacteria bacterium]
MAKRKKEKSFPAKLGRHLFGLALIFWVLSLIAGCIFFNPSDAGYNLASSLPAKNLLGLYGAQNADLILTWFGIALPIFLIAPLIWGFGFVRLHEMVRPWWRLFAFGLGTVCLATTLSLLSSCCSAFRLGGNIGLFFSRNFLTLVRRIYIFDYAQYILAAIFLLVAFVSFNLACGLTLGSWLRLCKKIAAALMFAARKTAAGFVWFGGLFKRKDAGAPHAKKTKTKREPKLRKEPTVSEKPAETIKIAKPRKPADDGYQYPSINLLSTAKDKSANTVSQKELDKTAAELEAVLQEFGVNGKIVKVRPGPVVTLYELEPAPGTKSARVIGLADDIARSMSAVSVRIAVVPGSNTSGIELPNKTREIVYLRDLLESQDFADSKAALTITLGKDIGGKNTYADLAKMPHLLVAGTTGSGKSVGVNSMIISLLYKMRPEECKLIMIDPKMLEFTMYNGIPHLLTPVITDPGKAVVGLKWAVREMEDRYRAMAKLNVRNITGYNKRLEELRESGEKVSRTVQTGFDAETGKPIYEEQELDLTPLPYIVIVVDEMADLMLVAGKEVEAAIQRLAQMARAAGIHLIMSTQRPSVDVITGTIKANFPTRISFQVTSKIDSRTILGEQGAEQLLGMGDMLYMPAGQRPNRVHAPFVKDSEVEQIVEFLKQQREPEYVEEVTAGELNPGGADKPVFDNGDFGSGSDDDLYRQAVEIVRNDKKASTSYVQRRLRIGYNRAATLIERMEEEGVISAPDHAGRREVL